jgi:hypothetical protein
MQIARSCETHVYALIAALRYCLNDPIPPQRVHDSHSNTNVEGSPPRAIIALGRSALSPKHYLLLLVFFTDASQSKQRGERFGANFE